MYSGSTPGTGRMKLRPAQRLAPFAAVIGVVPALSPVLVVHRPTVGSTFTLGP